MLAQVQITNTINITLILAVIAAIGIVAGPLIAMVFKVLRTILKEIYDLKTWQRTYMQEVTDAQTARIEACIHATPGHPENPKKWDGSDRRRQLPGQVGSQAPGREVK